MCSRLSLGRSDWIGKLEGWLDFGMGMVTLEMDGTNNMRNDNDNMPHGCLAAG
jgi:hypothetical protein